MVLRNCLEPYIHCVYGDCVCNDRYKFNILVNVIKGLNHLKEKINSDPKLRDRVYSFSSPYRKALTSPFIDKLSLLVNCFNEARKKPREISKICMERHRNSDIMCCENIFCNDRYLEKLFSICVSNKGPYKNPDIIVVMMGNEILFIEIKEGSSSRSHSRFTDQMRQTYQYIDTVFNRKFVVKIYVIYMPEGNVLPKGFKIDDKTRLLMKDLKKMTSFYEVPIIVMDRRFISMVSRQDILQYLRR